MTPDQFRMALKHLRWSQNNFAEITGHHPDIVRQWVNGKRRLPPYIEKRVENVLKEMFGTRPRPKSHTKPTEGLETT